MTPEQRRQITANAAQKALANVAPVLVVDAALEGAAQSTRECRAEKRAADMRAIIKAQERLKAARRALHYANLKRARRAARVEAALRAFLESIAEIDIAQAALNLAQKANDRAFIDAVDREFKGGLEVVGQPPALVKPTR